MYNCKGSVMITLLLYDGDWGFVFSFVFENNENRFLFLKVTNYLKICLSHCQNNLDLFYSWHDYKISLVVISKVSHDNN